MALPALTASSRPSSPPLSSHLLSSSSSSSLFSSSSSPALLFLYCRRLSCFRRTTTTSNGDAKTKPLLLSPAETIKARQYEDESGGSVSQFVEVIAIGSRKDAVLDFCVDSPFSSNKSLRFWNFMTKDSKKVYLQQRLLSEDVASPSTIEATLFSQSCPKAIVLVASAGYGSDDDRAIDILQSIRSANGYAVAIISRPFSFEGQRRKDEVNNLVGRLQENTNFCIGFQRNLFSCSAK